MGEISDAVEKLHDDYINILARIWKAVSPLELRGVDLGDLGGKYVATLDSDNESLDVSISQRKVQDKGEHFKGEDSDPSIREARYTIRYDHEGLWARVTYGGALPLPCMRFPANLRNFIHYTFVEGTDPHYDPHGGLPLTGNALDLLIGLRTNLESYLGTIKARQERFKRSILLPE